MSMDIDINMDTSRDRLLVPSNSSSRESSILSTTSLIPYCEWIEIQNNNPLWSKQIKAEEIAQSLKPNVEKNNTLEKQVTGNSSKAGKQHEVNEALALNNMPSPWGVNEANDKHNLGLQQDFYVIPITNELLTYL